MKLAITVHLHTNLVQFVSKCFTETQRLTFKHTTVWQCGMLTCDGMSGEDQSLLYDLSL